nr:MAG: hypothetical protein [Bacteriophage sp.]
MGKFVDEVGAIRHAMSDKELNELYKRLENFIADCTVEEAKESRDALVKVKTMIYQRMRETKKIILTAGGNPGTNREQK